MPKDLDFTTGVQEINTILQAYIPDNNTRIHAMIEIMPILTLMLLHEHKYVAALLPLTKRNGG